MLPLREMPDAVAGAIAAVFADIDDTITHDGRLAVASEGGVGFVEVADHILGARRRIEAKA